MIPLDLRFEPFGVQTALLENAGRQEVNRARDGHSVRGSHAGHDDDRIPGRNPKLLGEVVVGGRRGHRQAQRARLSADVAHEIADPVVLVQHVAQARGVRHDEGADSLMAGQQAFMLQGCDRRPQRSSAHAELPGQLRLGRELRFQRQRPGLDGAAQVCGHLRHERAGWADRHQRRRRGR